MIDTAHLPQDIELLQSAPLLEERMRGAFEDSASEATNANGLKALKESIQLWTILTLGAGAGANLEILDLLGAECGLVCLLFDTCVPPMRAASAGAESWRGAESACEFAEFCPDGSWEGLRCSHPVILFCLPACNNSFINDR